MTTLTQYKRLILIEHMRVLAEDELDMLLRILGHDPATLRAPLPNPTLIEEMDGLA
jgi:hypothetical protein